MTVFDVNLQNSTDKNVISPITQQSNVVSISGAHTVEMIAKVEKGRFLRVLFEERVQSLKYMDSSGLALIERFLWPATLY